MLDPCRQSAPGSVRRCDRGGCSPLDGLVGAWASMTVAIALAVSAIASTDSWAQGESAAPSEGQELLGRSLAPRAEGERGTWLLETGAEIDAALGSRLERHLLAGGRLVLLVGEGEPGRRSADDLLARLQVAVRISRRAPSRDEYHVLAPFIGLPGLQPMRGGRGARVLDLRPPARALLGPSADQPVLAVCRPAASTRGLPGGEVFVLSDPSLLSEERASEEPARSFVRALLGGERPAAPAEPDPPRGADASGP